MCFFGSVVWSRLTLTSGLSFACFPTSAFVSESFFAATWVPAYRVRTGCIRSERVISNQFSLRMSGLGYEMIDSLALSHEAVTNLNTDSKAQRQESGGSPHVTRRENKEEQLRQNCGTTCQRDVVL